MPRTRQTSPSTPKLSEAARHVVYPLDIVSSAWPRVRQRCAEMGVTFDGWQEGLGQLTFGKREDGRYAASVGGVFLSIPRQVGKTFFVGMVILALCSLDANVTVLWSAHRTRTASKTFDTMKGMAKRNGIAPHISRVRSANGEQEIHFRNGSVIMFGAREQGFGRGFDEVDVEVFDEAQILTEKALDDMIPAANQSRQPAGALVFYMGTPPRPVDPGEVFRSRRAEALSGESEGMVYVEMSADEDADPATWGKNIDWQQVAKANPSFPAHTSRDAIRRMFKSLTPASMRREALGIWDAGNAAAATIPTHLWRAPALVATAPEGGQLTYGVRFARDEVALAVCAATEAGAPHVEVVSVRPMADGIDWLAEWISVRAEERPQVVIDGREGAELLVSRLHELKFPRSLLMEPTVVQVIDAHAEFLNAVRQGAMTHADQPGLNQAVRSAGKRKIGTAGGWGWTSIDEGSVIALEAATLALGLRKKPARKSAKGRGFVG